MFEKEAKEYAIENYETCLYDDLPYTNDSKAIEQAFEDGAEFGYNKAFVEADKNLKAIFTDFNKAKELIQDLIDSLEVIDGEQIRELKVVKEAEQFLLNIERYENGK